MKKKPVTIKLETPKWCPETVNSTLNTILTRLNNLANRVGALESTFQTYATNQWDDLKRSQDELNAVKTHCTDLLQRLTERSTSQTDC